MPIDSNEHELYCKDDDVFLAKLANGTANSSLIPFASFPASAIVQCGKFMLYYEDLATTPLEGFADPNYGATSRNTLCAVLTYIENTLDFSNVPGGSQPGNCIRIYIRRSYTPSNPNVASGSNANGYPAIYNMAANAVYNFTNTGTSHIVNGDIFDYATTGIDPRPNDYHAFIQVNFDKGYSNNTPFNIFWQYDYSLSNTHCEYDLYSVLLHEVTHALGFKSFIKASGTQLTSSIGFDQYSGLDASYNVGLQNGSNFTYTGLLSSATPPFTINSLYVNNIQTISLNSIWLNNSNPPNNYPIYSGAYTGQGQTSSFLSHFDGQMWSFSNRGRNSPGYYSFYVMSPVILLGLYVREYTKAEIAALKAIGYSFSNTYITSSLGNNKINNNTPYSSKTGDMQSAYNSTFFPDDVVPDAILVNNTGASVFFDLALDNNLVDADLDPISVAPGTLFNIRGCGNGGNNHNQLTLSNGDQKITYTPRPGFVGRAQFGFYLYDGKEQGSFHYYTIDVTPGTSAPSYNATTNMIINGDFEEGKETKIQGFSPNCQTEDLPDAAYISHNFEGAFTSGALLSDANPFQYYIGPGTSGGGGSIIRDEVLFCTILNGQPHSQSCSTNFTAQAGTPYNTFLSISGGNYYPYPAGGPPSGTGIGDRYSPFYRDRNIFTLNNDLKPYETYTLEFDVFTQHTVAGSQNFIVGFTNSIAKPYNLMSYNYSFNSVFNTLPSGVSPSNWSHFSVTFLNCSNTSSRYMNLEISPVNSSVHEYFIDNVSLKPTNPNVPFSAIINPITPSVCVGNSIQLTGSSATSGITAYTWNSSANYTVSQPAIIVATPITTSTYSLTVTDANGCVSPPTTVSVVVNPYPTVNAGSDISVCNNVTTSLTCVTNGNSCVWSPSSGLSCTNCLTTTAAVTATTTYTATASLNGCSASDNVIVNVIPNPVGINLTFNYSPCPASNIINATISGCPGGIISYNWSCSNGGTIINNLSNTSISIGSAGVYTLSVTSTCSSCPFSQSITITSTQIGSLITIPAGATSSNLGVHSNGYSNANIYIPYSASGFNVNTNFSFQNCTVYIQSPPTSMAQPPNLGINIMPNANLTIDNSILTTCDSKMWEGIMGGTTNSSITVINNSIIEKARFGVYLNYGATTVYGSQPFYFENSTFRNNDEHIVITQLPQGNNGFIQGCLFDGQVGSIPGFTAIDFKGVNHLFSKTTNAITLLACDLMTIGNSSALSNQIQNCDVGVYAQDATVSVFNTNFLNCSNYGIFATDNVSTVQAIPYTPIPTPPSYNNITVGSSLATAVNSIYSCSFTNCNTGINTTMNNVYVYWNSFTSCNYGVVANYLLRKKAYIHNNQINYPLEGIRINITNQPSLPMQMPMGGFTDYISIAENTIIQNGGQCKQNLISPPPGKPFGTKSCQTFIAINHIDIPNIHNRISINRNIISGSDIGIWMQGAQADNVADNNIILPTYSGASTAGTINDIYGIKADYATSTGPNGINITCNYIGLANNNFHSGYRNGIYLTNGGSINVHTNTLSNLERGIVSNGVTSPQKSIRYIRNKMYNNSVAGISRINNSNPGDQPNGGGSSNGNQWLPGYSWYSNHPQTFVANVNTPNAIFVPYTIFGGNGSMNIFNALTFGVSPLLKMGESNSNLLTISALNNCHTIISSGCINCLTVSDDLLAQEQFALQVANDELRYFQFENGARFADAAAVYNSLDEHPEWRMENDTLFLFYDSLQNRPIGQFAELKHLLNQAFDEVTDSIVPSGILLQALDFNTTIDAQHICEQNWKDYYSVALKMLNEQRTNFNDDEEVVLLRVAGQCVHEGCEAVLLSRALLMNKYDYVWDDSLLCDSSYAYRIVAPINHMQKKNKSNDYNNNDIILKPNPAKDLVEIQFENLNTNTTIELFNSIGQKVLIKSISDKSLNQQLNVTNLSNGVYYCKVILNKKIVITKKVIIIK